MPNEDSSNNFNDNAQPIAYFKGEPLSNMPKDLFIPPDALRILLSSFEGPLDLLLHLIRKHNLDVLDIPMAEITAQYTSYIELMESYRFDLAVEYLLMAAILVDIKSKILLPRDEMFEENVEDPRAELSRKLIEYEKIKQASTKLQKHPTLGRDFFTTNVFFENPVIKDLPSITIQQLQDAFMGVLSRSSLRKNHIVLKENLSVRSEMTNIMSYLRKKEIIDFEELILKRKNLSFVIVNFLAILELTKEKIIDIFQNNPNSKIYIKMIENECEL